MLRLVDTLDMCEERVSPSYLSIVKERMPDISRFHWLSHLSVKDCKFETYYQIMDDGNDDMSKSFIDFKNIAENIQLTIELNTKQDTTIGLSETTCESVSITTCDTGIKLHFHDGMCNSNVCPFVCKWQKEKSPYLFAELHKIQQMLNEQDNYYASELSIEYKYATEETMGEHIPFISQYLRKQDHQKPSPCIDLNDIDFQFED